MVGNSPMITSTPSIFFCWWMEKSFEIVLGDVPPPPPFYLLDFRKYIRSMGWSWISIALTFNQLVKSSILELDNKTENYYNYDVSRVSNTYWFRQILYSFIIIRILGTVTEGKEKERGKWWQQEESNKNLFVSTVSNL